MKADLGDHIQNISLQEVLYLPELENNLLSVHAVVQLLPSKRTDAKFLGIQRS